MVFMVAIARWFGALDALNQRQTKALIRTKPLTFHVVFERMGADAKFVSLLC
jgi:hypothetical protein